MRRQKRGKTAEAELGVEGLWICKDLVGVRKVHLYVRNVCEIGEVFTPIWDILLEGISCGERVNSWRTLRTAQDLERGL